ncbi:MAG: 16S rRNA processing protein RimM [Clostridia bacterium]|nr:16S rRNA processing protein RimM [Clostridia bacterium]
MENTLEIGVVAKPQGVKGELKVYPLGQDMLRLECLKKVYIEGKTYNIESIKFGGGFMIISLFGINDRNEAELFRGKYLSAERSDLPELEEGNYYIVDMLGMSLYVGETLFGEILDIQSLKTDVITAKKHNGKIVRFPFVKKLNAKVDIENKTMKVDEKPFEEVVCYED